MSLDRVLIVDDDPEVRDILRKFLVLCDYQVDEAEEGETAWASLRKKDFAICLLDINIPHLSGLDILDKVMRDPEFITSVVVMTGQADVGTIVNIMRLGAEDYLQKPFSMAEMKIAIERARRIWAIKVENLRYKFSLESEVARKTEGIRRSYLDVVRAFAGSIEMRDPYTGGHTKRVSEIAVLFAAAMGFDENKRDEFRIGGILHDIGKIGIPDQILRKTGLLTGEEYDQIKKHPMIGREIIRSIESMNNMVPYVLYHHERYDGAGYPEGLAKDAIPIEGRILALADAVDAMVSDRIYRPKMNLDLVYSEVMKNSGTQFDPSVVEVYRELWSTQAIHQIIGG